MIRPTVHTNPSQKKELLENAYQFSKIEKPTIRHAIIGKSGRFGIPPVEEFHFHMKGFAPRLVLKQRRKVTRSEMAWS